MLSEMFPFLFMEFVKEEVVKFPHGTWKVTDPGQELFLVLVQLLVAGGPGAGYPTFEPQFPL